MPTDDGEDGGPPLVEDDSFPSQEELMAGLEDISLTPAEHQRLKNLVNDDLDAIKGYERRYLSVGAGGDSDAADRRDLVYELLDERRNPPAVAFRLEDYGLTREEISLWARAFDLLCGRATHIVATIEDFHGGYVWELGLVFAPSYREKAWILKRAYDDPEIEREKYENGMAISHVKLLLTGQRCHEWRNTAELRDTVGNIP